MRYASVCSGIEAPSVAWHPLAWSPVFLSEIDKFPCAVLKHHYPHVPNHGDMNGFKDWPDAAFDLLVGGTPCQSFSVAGLRKGLADPRGNLALTYLAIADRFKPAWVLWENVPGVLSSDGGRDFGAFLGGLGQLGYGWAYRILDAQYVRVDGLGRAVPQRRRRVFVVGYLGDWRRAAAVLFERESLFWDSAPRREAGKGTSYDVAPCIAASGRGFERSGDTRGQDCLIPFGGNNTAGPIDVATARNGHGGPHGRLDFESETLVSHSLRADGFDASEDGTGRGTPVIPINLQIATRHEALGRGTGFGFGDEGDPAYTLSKAHQHAIAFSCKDHGADAGETAPTPLQGWAVRRLTPLECERLQGFPDGYTDIPYRGKQAADGPRYKALGNSMAVNVIRWIGRRIDMVEAALSQSARAA